MLGDNRLNTIKSLTNLSPALTIPASVDKACISQFETAGLQGSNFLMLVSTSSADVWLVNMQASLSNSH